MSKSVGSQPVSGNIIYKEFCSGMIDESRETIRIIGSIARKISRGTSASQWNHHHPSTVTSSSHIVRSGTGDTLTRAANDFCLLDPLLDNIENNLNKVCALTKIEDSSVKTSTSSI